MSTYDPYFGNELELRRLINEMTRTISTLSRDLYLKGLVGSVFDTMTVEMLTNELKAYNDGYHPRMIHPKDVKNN